MKGYMKIKTLMHFLLSIIISTSIIFYPVKSSIDAGVGDKMEEVFNVLTFRGTITSPGIYKSQKGGIMTGGSIILRGGGFNPPIFQINPPSIKAGCGGIDIFFGAFQYVNAQQLVNMLKNIGQAALGYAFKLGLETVCSSCSQVLDALVNFANQLARLAQDSCAIGKLIAKGIFGDPSQAAEGIKGQCQSAMYAENESAIRTQEACDGPNFLDVLTNKLNEWTQDMRNLELMNLPGSVAETVGRKLGFSTEDIEIMRSFAGDIVLKGTKTVGDGQNKKTIPLHDFVEPTLDLTDIMYGNPNAKFIEYDETTKEVRHVAKGYLANGGFKKKVYEYLKGINQAIKNNMSLTQEQQAFVDNCPFPIIPLLIDANKIPDLSDSIIENIADFLSVAYAYALADYYIRTILTNSSKQPHVDIKEAYKKFEERRKMLMTELESQVRVLEGQFTALSLAMFYAKQIRQNISAGLKGN